MAVEQGIANAAEAGAHTHKVAEAIEDFAESVAGFVYMTKELGYLGKDISKVREAAEEMDKLMEEACELARHAETLMEAPCG